MKTSNIFSKTLFHTLSIYVAFYTSWISCQAGTYLYISALKNSRRCLWTSQTVSKIKIVQKVLYDFIFDKIKKTCSVEQSNNSAAA